MIRKRKGKIVGEDKMIFFDKVDDICKSIYNDYANRSEFIFKNHCFYFRLLKSYSNYYFQFLIIKHEYFY